jgi:transcriptional regulator with XRE-family HTH domain
MTATTSPQSILDNFVVFDHRLSDHPQVEATVFLLGTNGELAPSYRTHPRWARKFPLLNRVYSTGSSRDVSRPVFTNDPGVSQVGAGLWSEVPDRFIQSSASFPLVGGHDRKGVLTLSAPETVDFKRYEDRLALLAALISFAILPPRARRYSTPDLERIGSALRRVRESLGLTQQALSELTQMSRIALGQAELGKGAFSLGQLSKICTALGLATESPTIVQIIDVNSRLSELLRDSPEYVHTLSPTQFEQFVAERLDRMGFDVVLTGNTFQKDGGVDLIAVPKLRSLGAFLLAGQVKHHRAGVATGREDVDRLLAWRGTQFSVGLLVTNTRFSPDAQWLMRQGSNSAFLRLRDFEDLRRWIFDDFGSEDDWRELPEQIEVAPGVIVRVPRPSIPNYKELWPDFRAL